MIQTRFYSESQEVDNGSVAPKDNLDDNKNQRKVEVKNYVKQHEKQAKHSCPLDSTVQKGK